MYAHWWERTRLTGVRAVGLYRHNLSDGTVTVTLQDSSSSGGFYDIAFSPDGRRFAYDFASYTNHFAIVDLRTGDEFTIEDGGGGNLTWSPDGTYLAYGICYATQNGNATAKSTINVFSIETHSSRTVLEVKQILLRIVSQNGDQVLIIGTYNYQAGTFDYPSFNFNWSSGQLSTPTPTP
jgi:Tol biopolymer transport system component